MTIQTSKDTNTSRDDDDIDDNSDLQCSDDGNDEAEHQQIWNLVGNITLKPTQIQNMNDDGDVRDDDDIDDNDDL